ncbi:MAG: thiol peroxidase [Oscillibacter sp.]|nr:thiol peroxidase [Oscillibacter sp.]
MEITMHGNRFALNGEIIQTGTQAPEFTAVDADLKPIKLSDYKGKIIVISSFPSIDTSVCSSQMHHFNQMAAQLGQDVVIIAISCDLPFALKRYCAAEGIEQVVTLSDYKDVEFGTRYGFLIPALRLLTRGVILIGKDNEVKYVEYVSEITQEPNYEKALEAIKKLKV